MSGGRFAVLLAAVLCAASVPAAAQTARRAVRPPSFELGGGVTWAGSFTGPSRAAELTRNERASGGFDLFRFSSEVTNGPGVGAWIGYHLTRAVALEGGFRYSKPELAFRLTGDLENAPDATATETLERYVITGSLVLHLRPVDGRRFVPFVAAGAGYIRDLHELRELVETGREYHGVGGVKYWFGAGRRRVGLRAQAGVTMSDGGFDFREESRTVPTAAVGLVYLF